MSFHSAVTQDFTAAYDKYAVYLPSLQNAYATMPLRNERDMDERSLPRGLKLSDLDFLNGTSSLWTCKYILYSAGQFRGGRITTPDIVSTRASDTVVIGDSGGYQIGTGKLPGISNWANSKSKADEIYRRWMTEPSIRDGILRWLDRYCDYAMTLDMPLWVLKNKVSKASPFSKLSVQQLIELSVENARYFADKRGAATGAKAKYLNVIQDIGDGTGEAWYDAVKDFDFEGWSLAGETKDGLENTLKWVRKLLDDKKLDKAEWLHILMASPPIHAVYFTALQDKLRELLGREIRVSYDSSTPFQNAGVRHKIAHVPTLTNDIKTWTIPSQVFPQSPKYQQQDDIEYLTDFPSPVTQRFSINDFHSERGEFAQTFLSSAGVQLLTNHNLYVYHRTAADACELVFQQKNMKRVPSEIQKNLKMIEGFF